MGLDDINENVKKATKIVQSLTDITLKITALIIATNARWPVQEIIN